MPENPNSSDVSVISYEW